MASSGSMSLPSPQRLIENTRLHTFTPNTAPDSFTVDIANARAIEIYNGSTALFTVDLGGDGFRTIPPGGTVCISNPYPDLQPLSAVLSFYSESPSVGPSVNGNPPFVLVNWRAEYLLGTD